MDYYGLQEKKKSKQILLILLGMIIFLVLLFMILAFKTIFQKNYIVRFQFNNGQENLIVQVKRNSTISKIDDPIMENYEFVGWALGDSLYQFDSKVTTNLVLDAVWKKLDEPSDTNEIIRYNVIFNTNGGSSVQNTTVIKYGLLTKPENPVKEGYTFVGWKLNDSYYDFSSKIVSDIILIAVWEKKPENNPISPTPSNTPTSTPTPTPVPSNTPTPKPTQTPVPTPTPSNTPTPSPSNTPKPTTPSVDKSTSNKVTSISVSPKNLSIEKGKSTSLTVTYSPDDAKLTKLTWKSSNTNVATVDNYGKVTATSVGTTVITVKDTLNNSAKCTVTVIQKPTSISLNDTTITLKKGNTKQLSLTFYPSDTTEKNVTWKSNNTSVITVNSKGVVTAVGGGTTTVTATTTNGKTATIEIVVDTGRLELLKDTKFNNGFELWLDANEKNYMCVNCKGQQYWYIASWNFPPKFINSYQENGYYFIDASQGPNSNNKLVTYNNQGELRLAMNTYGANYSSTDASGWPHLLLDGMAGTNNKYYDFYSYSDLEQKYYSFTGNNIWYHVDVRLDYYSKGNPIHGIQAAQYLSYIELRDKVTKKMIWFGFNLFDDRANYQDSYVSFDLYTQNYIYSLGTETIYNGMGNSIYNNGNFVYGKWKTVDVNISNYIDDVVRLANEKQIFGRNITQDDLFIGAVNIGFEIHGEYHIGMSMKDLQITSIEK